MSTAPEFRVPDPTQVPDDVRFYYRHARRSQHPVLDLGGAAGRFCLPLAEQQIPVVVVDADESMLTALQAFADRHGFTLSTRTAALGEFAFERTFGMIYLPAGRLAGIVSFDEQLATLRRIRDHLPIGGKLAFDVPVPQITDMALNMGVSSQSLTMRETHRDADAGETTYVWERLHYDPIEQVETRHEVHERIDAEGRSLERFHRVERYAFFWPRQVRALLLAAGYMIEAVYGGFNDEPLTAESQVQVWLARRPID